MVTLSYNHVFTEGVFVDASCVPGTVLKIGDTINETDRQTSGSRGAQTAMGQDNFPGTENSKSRAKKQLRS